MNLPSNYEQFLQSFASKKFTQLREAQRYILSLYSEEYYENTDVAIELPTGAGKTLISLLIAESWRRENKKVAILSANKTLARQMQSEANLLGIPSVLMEGRGVDIPNPDKRAYHRAFSIAIMNYWVYFNQNPTIDPANLLIMDDSHLAEHCLHSLFSVEINRKDHLSLFAKIVRELGARFPEYSILADALSNDNPLTIAPELLSFIDQESVVNIIREIVDTSDELRNDSDLRFRWNRIRNSLREENIYMGINSIWIRPYIYPLLANEYYSNVDQRLYTSATVGNPNDLSRRLGVKPIIKIPVPSVYSERTSGRRLIVMNTIEDVDIPGRLSTVIYYALKKHPKSVWLCSSDNEAKKYQKIVSDWLELNEFKNHKTWLLTSLGNEIEEFKNSKQGHLFVAGRFDGMDFNADECRLVILATLPRAINLQEEFVSTYLRDSGFMRERLNHRIVQALGRCNRSENDFGLYILADRRFATHFGREQNREGLPRNIVAEIDMAQDNAEIEVDELITKVDLFLKKDFKCFDEEYESYIAQAPSMIEIPTISDTSNDEIIGWASLMNQNYPVSVKKFQKCWDTAVSDNLLEMAGFYGWQWAKALYLHSLLGDRSAMENYQAVFESAIERGGSSSWFNRMRASLNRVRNSTEYIEQTIKKEYASQIILNFDEKLERWGNKDNKFVGWCEKVTRLLESDNHNQYQEGLEELGFVLGFTASRPKHDASTDCLWRGVFGNQKEIITFEAKIEHNLGKEVTSHHIGQALTQNNRAKESYESQGYTIRGTIVTHLEVIAENATATLGSIKVIPKSAMLELWNNVQILLSLYRDEWSLYGIPARKIAAQKIAQKIPDTGWAIRALDSKEQFISSEILLAEWK